MSTTITSHAARHTGIDTLRGLACLLLVGLHVIGEAPEHGLRVAEDHPLAIFTGLFFHLRMPLFAMLSGFVYAWRPVQPGQVGGFVTGKLQRLGLPLLFAAGSFALINTVLGGAFAVEPAQFWTIFVTPYAQFWFLQAILLLFIVIAVADALFPKAPLNVAVGMLAISGAIFLSSLGREVEIMSLDRAIYLAPFFAFGIVLNRIGTPAPKALVNALLFGTALLFVVNALLVMSDPAAPMLRRTILGLSFGLCFSGLLVLRHVSMRWLAWIGTFSFTIYLYHMFAVMALQMGYNFVGMPNPYLGLALGLVAGIGAPIVFHLVTQRVGGWPMRIALGLSPRKAKPQPAAIAPNPDAWPETGR